MDSQAPAHHRGVPDYDHDPKNVGLRQVAEGGNYQDDEQHDQHEKKSVLKKVKAKAKKIKDTIIKHGHHDDHDYHRDQVPDYHDLDEEEDDDDEDKEIGVDPEVHGAPMYESAAMRNALAGNVENTQPRGNFERSDAVVHDRSRVDSVTGEDGSGVAAASARGSTSVPGQEGSKVNVRGPAGLVEDPNTQENSPQRHYQTKVTDPIGQGSIEAGMSDILHSFDKMNVYGDQQTDHLPESTAAYENPKNQATYTEKISAATSVVADKAKSTKNVVVSKIGYGEGPQSDGGVTSSVTEKLSSVYGKVVGAGKVLTGYNTSNTEKESDDHDGKGQDKGVSIKGYFADKLKPGEEEKALSEVISDALSKRRTDVDDELSMGKVTESEEVSKRLGPDRTEEGDVNSTRKAMVDKVKDTVGSWLGKGGGVQTSSPSVGSSQGVEGFVDSATGERRLQESSN